MKKLFLLLLVPIISFGQYTKTVKQTKVLVEKRDIHLNGGLRASTGGDSREVVPIDLPKNTVEWYYSFSTSAAGSGTKNLKLALQLGTLLADPSGISSKIVDNIQVPSGTSKADVFLFDGKNRVPFLNKELFYYIGEGTTENTKHGVVKIDDVTNGKYYIGFRNPSTLNGLNISIEVVAIVQNKVYVDEWTTTSKEKIRNSCMNSFKTKEAGRHDVCECATEKLLADKKPSEWKKLSKSSRHSFVKSEKSKCYEETGNTALLNAEKKQEEILEERRKLTQAVADSINEYYKAAHAASKLGDYPDAINQMNTTVKIAERHPNASLTDKDKWLCSCYNSMAWWSLLDNNIENAGEYLKKALMLDSKNMYVRGNLGLYHLLNNNYNLAKEAFTYYKRREKMPNGDRWFKVIGSDLETLENRGISHPNFDKVRELLRIR